MSEVAPVEIGRANVADVKIRWAGGHESIFPARELRMACPCAACVDEFTGTIRIINSEVPQDVHPVTIEPVGRYAISIHWSDGHHTGIYSFDRLRAMCPCCQGKRVAEDQRSA